MPKSVPVADEKEYIRLTKLIDGLELKRKPIKRKLLIFHQKGYVFNLIRPSDVSGGFRHIPWQEIAQELIEKLFKTKVARISYMKSLYRRFPKTERAPTLHIPGKKVKVDA